MRIDSERISRAMRVLTHVRNRLKGMEFEGFSHIGTETYCNGREQGLCLVVYPKNRKKDVLRVMFSEHRISDGIVVHEERGLGQNGNIPIGIRGERDKEMNFRERTFEGGQREAEAKAGRAIFGIIESYDIELSGLPRR